jgi:hypothetical protein
MATKKETTVVSKLVTKICSILKLGDEGKVNNFFTRQLRDLRRNLEKAQRNVEMLNVSRVDLITDFEDQMEDATKALEDAFLNVDVESITTNAHCDAYAEFYWSAISDAERHIENIEKSHKSMLESVDSDILEAEKVVAKLLSRIEKIS